MKKIALFVGVSILIAIQTYPAMGTPIEVSVTTDKPIYLLGEEIGISIIAFNPNNYEVTIDALSSYRIDDGDWLPIYIMWVWPPIPLPSFSSHSWEHTYTSIPGSSRYPLLEVGVHSVVGAAAEYAVYPAEELYIQSEPFQFSVVPEPATIFLFGLGSLALLKKN